MTRILQNWRNGSADAVDELLPLVYAELRRLARRHLRGERPEHTLQPTALVHEAYLRLVGKDHPQWQDRAHFFAVAAQQMRRVLVDHARAHGSLKRGGDAARVTFDEDLLGMRRQKAIEILALNEALEELAAQDARKARILEMRYFAGMTLQETAEALDLSTSTVNNETRFARAWLRSWAERLSPRDPSDTMSDSDSP